MYLLKAIQYSHNHIKLSFRLGNQKQKIPWHLNMAMKERDWVPVPDIQMSQPI